MSGKPGTCSATILALWAAIFLGTVQNAFTQVCGDGHVDPGEQCDNGGQSGGCCTVDCKFAPAGSACNDGNPRTVDSCNNAGLCVGTFPPPPTCTPPATYNQQTGACSYAAQQPVCGDGIVNNGEQCDNGSQCANGTDCTGNPGVCGDGSCQPRGGNCCTASCTFASSGTTCDDGNGCTPNDACDGNGICVGTGQVNCDGSDACHPTNFCSPATGTCATCRDPNDVQDQSYCSLDTGQCVTQIAPCPEFLTDATGQQNLCAPNYGRDPATGQCLYRTKECQPTDCNDQQCNPATGACEEVATANCGFCINGQGGDYTKACPESTCTFSHCSPNSPDIINCDAVTIVNCSAENRDGCQVPTLSSDSVLGCEEPTGCMYNAVSCPLPANPCQELVRDPNTAGCCTYKPRDCAGEFDNNPNYVYSCNPTPVTGGCRAQRIQTIIFNPIPAQVQGTPVNLVATASSGLPVSFSTLTPTICTVSGPTATLLAPGTCTIQASQPGNNVYAAANSVSQSFTVQGTQSITFNPITTQVQGATVNLVGSSSSGLPVSFSTLTPTVCTVSGSTLALLLPGTCTIQASQAGNSIYAAATPVLQSFAVAGFSITARPSSENVSRGRLAAFLLVLQSINGFRGNVTVTCTGGPPNSVCGDFPKTVPLSGTAYAVSGVLFPNQTAPGTYTITFAGVSGSATANAIATFKVK